MALAMNHVKNVFHGNTRNDRMAQIHRDLIAPRHDEQAQRISRPQGVAHADIGRRNPAHDLLLECRIDQHMILYHDQASLSFRTSGR